MAWSYPYIATIPRTGPNATPEIFHTVFTVIQAPLPGVSGPLTAEVVLEHSFDSHPIQAVLLWNRKYRDSKDTFVCFSCLVLHSALDNIESRLVK
ncbi:hypothetical protein CBS63078_4660 [Aspergillus niger]|nr:hypothetical protein CBS115989_2938 [Aspergillus niger]KAI2847218.1 hypothetical protein CBS11350_3227 [Aspergillus niger]KAI2857012.1 hypothetical protein CBS11232_3447 [Aspergillus niger]KAI2877680.1 hypothetical protein CBS115988_3807 [Aspergillus niger]KAI2885710.1 hypothetical protein CBS13152_7324 [Aspergillus niger]